jgi:hypothetical protein
MECCDYCSVPILTKSPPYIKRVQADILKDGEYPVLEDYWYESLYDLRRTLTLEKPDGKVLYVRLPASCKAPDQSLSGGTIVKYSLKSEIFAPCYGETYIIEFHLKPCCD